MRNAIKQSTGQFVLEEHQNIRAAKNIEHFGLVNAIDIYWHPHRGALPQIIVTCWRCKACEGFIFLLGPESLRIKCGLKSTRASCWCQSPLVFTHFRTSHLKEPNKQRRCLSTDKRSSTIYVDIFGRHPTWRTSQNSWYLFDIGACFLISLPAPAPPPDTFLFLLLSHIRAYLHIWSHPSAYAPSICALTALCTAHAPAFNSTDNS